MKSENLKALYRIRIFSLIASLSVIILSTLSFVFQSRYYQNCAIGFALIGLIILTFLTSSVISRRMKE